MNVNLRRVSLLFFLPFSALPSVAWANAGIPMLVLAWPVQILALIPIVLIESLVIAKSMQEGFRSQLWPVAKANLLSTLVGVPLAWLGMLAIEAAAAGLVFGLLPESVADVPAGRYAMYPLMAAWIGGSTIVEFQVAFLVLAIPFFLISFFIEYRFLRRDYPESRHVLVRSAIKNGNAITYALLCLFVVVSFQLFQTK
jgi:hypothetical protein